MFLYLEDLCEDGGKIILTITSGLIQILQGPIRFLLPSHYMQVHSDMNKKNRTIPEYSSITS
jgi:hypothetical protein